MAEAIILNQLVLIAQITITPVLLLYTLIAFKSGVEKTLKIGLVLSSLFLSASALLAIYNDTNPHPREELNAIQHVFLFLAMASTFFLLRHIVHARVYAVQSHHTPRDIEKSKKNKKR